MTPVSQERSLPKGRAAAARDTIRVPALFALGLAVAASTLDDAQAQSAAFTVDWSSTTITENGSATATVTTTDTSVEDDTWTLVTLHVGRDEGTADPADVEVTMTMVTRDAGGLPVFQDIVVQPREIEARVHHNGGWLYVRDQLPYSRAHTAALTLRVLDDADAATEELAVWVYVNGELAGSQTLSLIPSNATLQASTVGFGASSHTAAEGGADATVTVSLDQAPGIPVTIPISRTNLGSTTDGDYTGVPGNVVFGASDTSRTFAVAAVDDSDDDDGDSVRLGFGTLPTGIAAAGNTTATVGITDNDATANTSPAVANAIPEQSATVGMSFSYQFPANTFGDADNDTLSYAATKDDGAALSTTWLSFAAAARTFSGTPQAADVGTVSVKVTAGDSNGGTAEDTFDIVVSPATDIRVSFGASAYTATEGGTAATATVTLSGAPSAEVEIVVEAVSPNGGAVVDDYSGLPATLAFGTADTSKSFTVAADDDTDDDDGESVTIGFDTLPSGYAAGTHATATVSLVDDEETVAFDTATATAVEGGADAVFDVVLSAAPTQSVTVPIGAAAGDGAGTGDYTLSPAADVTFNAGERSRTVTVTATDDDVDDDGETVTVTFGTLPAPYVTGATASATVTLDEPVNAAATGAPAITGTAAPGEILTADTTGIADANGLVSAELAYQWILTQNGSDADIADATGSTYTPTAADVQHTLKVRVTFTDDDGYDESRTSEPTAAVAVADTVDTVHVLDGWPLIPPESNIGPGDQFRLMFVTGDPKATGDAREPFDRIDATSTDINIYNEVVQLAALDGHAAMRNYAGHFRALASTAAVNARTNTATAASDTDTRIYWLGHRGRADDSIAEFYDGTRWKKVGIQQDEHGNEVRMSLNDFVWTGTNQDGTTSSAPLGSANPTVAEPNRNFGQMNNGETKANTDEYPLYALSGVFEVDALLLDVTGRAVVGETLTAEVDYDEPLDPAPGLQWLRDGTAIAGATDSKHTLVAEDAGKRIGVRITFTDPVHAGTTLTSPATSRVIENRKLVGSSNYSAGAAIGGGWAVLSTGFMTGANQRGYLVNRVVVEFVVVGEFEDDVNNIGADEHSARIMTADDSYHPGTLVQVLQSPSRVTAHVTYRAPAGTKLNADTKYAVALKETSSGTWSCFLALDSTSDDTDGLTDWNVAPHPELLNDDFTLSQFMLQENINHRCQLAVFGRRVLSDAPYLTGLAVSSTSSGGYATGDTIRITATFSAALTGTLSLPLDIGGNTVTLAASGTNTTSFVFSHTVVAGDRDDDGFTFGENVMTGLLDADLGHADLLQNNANRVNAASGNSGRGAGSKAEARLESTARESASGGPGPAAVSWAGLGAAAVRATARGHTVEFVYDRALDKSARPAPRDFVVEADGELRAILSARVEHDRVVLELAAPLFPGERVEASYPAPGAHPVRTSDGAVVAPVYRIPVTVGGAPGATAGLPRVRPSHAGAAQPHTEAAPDAPLRPGVPAARAKVAALAFVYGRHPELDRVPDGALAAAFAEALAAASADELNALGALRADRRGIVVLSGIGRASSLREIDLGGNAVSDLAPLEALDGLRRLDLAGNAVEDLWPLAGLADLRRLDLSGNRISDLAPLAGLSGLETLLLAGNAISDLTPLAHLASLVRLDLSGNPVSDLSPLADLPLLRRLDLANARSSDISPLGDVGALVWLDLSGSPLTDPLPLGRLAALRWLFADDAAALAWLAEPGRRPRLAVYAAPPRAPAAARDGGEAGAAE